MAKIYILHLEPLEERYTKQWLKWFRAELKARNLAYEFVEGKTLTNEVESGVVLDAEGTNYWKFTQMLEVCKLFKEKKINNNDIFFTMDLWHPSLEAIPYMATLEKKNVKIFGFLHAGSYTTEDFAEPMSDWASFFEKGWAKICDGIFVGSKYHKEKFIRKRKIGGLESKIYVTGNPFNTQDILKAVPEKINPVGRRENIVIFSHRWDYEKRPNVFVDMMNQLQNIRKDFKVYITTSRKKFRSNQKWLIEKLHSARFEYHIFDGLSKEQYYQLLSKSKIFVSTTIEENFGYCLLEAMTLGCTPVVPNKYSHPEILNNDSRFLYNNNKEAVKIVSAFLDSPISISKLAFKYNYSIGKIIDIMIKNRD
ncbi:hypothetical protein COX03_01170 [Candidatus Woesebacteria bacterium CG22_combo_CG10-13_8_21_14_all_39_10]|uniref:Glycosyl transferase family 1 domain-containing protein n=2 Tax=Candidatus Woeseibacteriota TaxID=1752722 RepID=A0A2H0BL68_9BACT|nr:MAG: hypothetical protein COX03_01170 [Candidatus Woesebacteria bacterium CG22_combo_CG10-13_8_21_14_all_39_10]PIZ50321.1 MAG: hypothetical protein COY29_00095 [Candidatus Woesebacteria bacterium CG_4_10_14_0_2_um_filter_39_14]